MPFWSTESRARRAIVHSAPLNGFEAVPLEWPVFRDQWIAGMRRDGLLCGINLTGSKLVGYELQPDDLATNVDVAIALLGS